MWLVTMRSFFCFRNMITAKQIYAIFYLFVLFAFTGCVTTISVGANQDKSTNVDFSLDLGNAVSAVLDSISAGMGNAESKDQPVFAKDTIQALFTSSDFSEVNVKTPTRTSLQISGKLNSIEKQNAAYSTFDASHFVHCTSNSLTIVLSPNDLRDLVANLTEEMQSYVDLLMAPLFTEEEMSEAEYLELIEAVYGKELALELKNASITIIATCPRGSKIRETAGFGVKEISVKSDKAIFSVPLTQLLTSLSTRSLSILW